MSVKIIGKAGVFARQPVPLFLETVSAGFPSPAQDYMEKSLDLNEHCVPHPLHTFFVRVSGDSMSDAGILPGDMLVVDRSLRAGNGDIVVARVSGEFTVKQLTLKPSPRLLPRKAGYRPIMLTDEMDIEICGVVSSVIRQLRRQT